MAADDAAALASYAAKWIARHPDFNVALAFASSSRRAVQVALACWSFEIEHAAYAAREAEPAAVKLHWWAEEWQRALAGAARHPLTRVLAAADVPAGVELADVHAVIVGALSQCEAQPAADGIALLERYASLYRPLGAIAASFETIDAAATARAQGLARALRETATLADSLRAGRLPLPLDVLARHRLARGDLTRRSPAQAAALREWIAFLAAQLDDLTQARPALGIVAATTLAADRARARASMRADDPASALPMQLSRVPLPATLAAWRAGRRLSRRR